LLRGKRAGPVAAAVAVAAAVGRTAPVVVARPRCPCVSPVSDIARHHAFGGQDQLLQGAQVQRRETVQIGVQR